MATLTVTMREELSLNGKTRGSENIMTISGITQADERVVTVGTTELTVLSFGSTIDAGQFKHGTVKYLRITNLDGTNTVEIRVLGGSEEYFVKLEPKGSYVLTNSSMDANATGSQTISLADMRNIKAKASAADTDIEIFVATDNS